MADDRIEVRELVINSREAQPKFWLAIHWPGEQQDSSPVVQLQLGRSSYEAVVMTWLVAVHLLCFSWIMNRQTSAAWYPFVQQGIVLAQISLISLWLAASPWALWKRFPTIALIASYGSSALSDRPAVVELACELVALSLLWGFARVMLGWRIAFRPGLSAGVPAWKGGGSIRGVLGYILAIGCLLGVYIRLDVDVQQTVQVFTYFGIALLLHVVWLMAALCSNCRGCLAVTAGVTSGYLLLVAIGFLFDWVQSQLLMAVACALSSIPLFAGSLYLIRRLGWRLVQFEAGTQYLGNSAAKSFDSLQ